MESLPHRTIQVITNYNLLVSNLPEDQDIVSTKCCLKQMPESCGGPIMEIESNIAIICFTSKSLADRKF
ncbi:hypothetical protein ANTQUA_LOCUS9206 [Anthophora quadrimaculata]